MYECNLLFPNPGGAEGHLSRECEEPAKEKDSFSFKSKDCFKCNQPGHIVSICFISLVYHLLTNDLLCSLVIAPIILAAEEVEVEEAEVDLENVTNVVKLAISLVHALMLLLVVEEGIVHLVVAILRTGLGRHFLFFYRRFLAHYLLKKLYMWRHRPYVPRLPPRFEMLQLFRYCKWLFLPFIESLLIDYSVSRVTEAETAPSLKSEPVTVVVLKAIFLAIALALMLSKQVMPRKSNFFCNG